MPQHCEFTKQKLEKPENCSNPNPNPMIPIISLNRYLTYWRSTDSSLSTSIIQRLSDAFKVYRYFEKFNLFKTFYFTILLALRALMKKINIYLR